MIVLNKNIIFDNIDKVFSAFKDYDEWIFNVISLEDGKSYIFYSNELIKNNFLLLFNATSLRNYLVLDNCMLRKEIMKASKEYENHK